jgi:phosphoserine phosphatase
MRLIIVRHAETGHNKKGKFQGREGNLSKEGEKQAKKMAHRLLKENIDAAYCSDYPRTKQTLKFFLELHKVKVTYTKDLREMSVGMFAGKKISEFFPWAESEVGKKWYGKFKTKMDDKMPGGESYNDLKKRVAKILEKIIKKEKGKNVLIITHGKIKTMMLVYLLKRDYLKYKNKYKIKNTGISVIHIKEDGNHRARLLNDVRHL